jgi:DNA-binding transcriptional regulator LsrR (DeoR family)
MTPEEQILVAAYYRSLNLSNEEIGRLLDLDVPTVRRRIQDAEKKRYLREVHVFSPGGSLAKIHPLLSNHRQAQHFLDILGRETLQNIIILPRMPVEFVDSRTLLGRAAAIHLNSVLRDDYRVGVSFGRTILGIAEAAQDLSETGELYKKSAEFYPLLGGLSVLSPQLTSTEAFRCAASSLASELARVFKGDMAGQMYLPTPAFVPKGFLVDALTAKERNERIATAQAFVNSIPEYQRIFGLNRYPRDKGALIAQMDIIITSVGGASGWLSTSGPIIDDKEGVQLTVAGVVGDICGNYVTAQNVSDFPAEAHIITEVNRRVFGASPLDLQACARRAVEGRGEKRPGVIMVANSLHKAAAVLSALRNRCVSTLIVDQELADELVRLYPRLESENLS